ncbi:MAG: hypothetical protein ACI4J1_08375, partial [Ruminiclostridium sp.]
MIRLKLRDFAVNFDFTFFAVMAMFCCLDTGGTGFMSVCACALHETGHLLAMKIKREKAASITFYGGGIKISRERQSSSVLVILGGVIVNFILAALFLFIKNQYMNIFGAINLITGLFNLLPVSCLDGKQLFDLILLKILPPQKALFCSHTLEIVNGVIAFIAV